MDVYIHILFYLSPITTLFFSLTVELPQIEILLKNPQSVTYREIDDIKAAIEKYPYFSALYVLLAKAEEGKAEYVKKAAAYVAHRPSLQSYLDTSFDADINLPNTDGIEFQSDDHQTLDILMNEKSEDLLEEENDLTVEDEIDSNSSNDQEEDTNPTEGIFEEHQIIDEFGTADETQEEDQGEESSIEDNVASQILNDLENAEPELDQVEPVETSVADQILAELAAMQAGQTLEPDTTSENEEVEEEEPITENSIEVAEDEEDDLISDVINEIDLTEEDVQTEEPTQIVNEEGQSDDEESNLISEEEMMNRFNGYLQTKNQSEEEIVSGLTEEEKENEDTKTLTDLSEEENVETQFFDEGIEEYNFPSYDTASYDETIKDEDYLQNIEELNVDNIVEFSQFDPVEVSEKDHQKDIINHFIDSSPTLTQKNVDDQDVPEDQIDLTEVDLDGFSTPQTESYAKLLERQGKKEDAISIYQHLILKNPNKASFFAERIEFLKQN